jgi:hypothetical protein
MFRSNLDPANAFSNSEIWAVLENVHMKSVVERLSEGIHSLVVESMFTYLFHPFPPISYVRIPHEARLWLTEHNWLV